MIIRAHLESDDSESNRRAAPRKTLRLETRSGLQTAGLQPALVQNVSATGLLLDCDDRLAIGEKIVLDLPLAGDVTAHVVWSSGTMHGCRFDAPLSPAALAAVKLRAGAAAGSTHDIRSAPSAGAAEPLGPRLKRLRLRQGLTLDQLAEGLKVSKPTVWAWENGKARPLAKRLAAIAEALGVDKAELTGPASGLDSDTVLKRSRVEIAQAFGVQPANVRIMIEI